MRGAQPGSPLVFISARGLKLWTADLGRIVKLYRDQAHLPDNITTHSLRHTCATEMLKGGASIRHVQELLGHADIATTQIYTHVVQSDLKKAHARTAPSERRKNIEVPRFPPVAGVAGDLPAPKRLRQAGGKPRWNDNRNAPYWKAVKSTKKLENGEENR